MAYKKNISRRISNACPPATYLLIPCIQVLDRLRGGEKHRELQTVIDRYCTEEEKRNPAYLRRIKRDMWYSLLRYYCPFNEYFMFAFPRLTHRGRQEFVTEYELLDVGTRLAPQEVRDVFGDKWNTYERFRQFYKRDVLRIDDSTALDDLAAFVAKHPRFIVKTRRGYGGHGVRCMDMTAQAPSPSPLRELLTQLQAEDVMLEEPIVQNEVMARPHPQSVNTIRCATFVKDGEVHFLFSHFRVGRGDKIVDNGSSGGLLASVDMETGIVNTPGVTEYLFSAIVHPDTGQQILGLRVPRWEEMKELSRQLALTYPQQPYVGWDLALTDSGWVMVEGNHLCGFNGPQLATQRGIRSLLSQYFDL